MHITLASGERHTFQYYDDLKAFLDRRRKTGDRAWVISAVGRFDKASRTNAYVMR